MNNDDQATNNMTETLDNKLDEAISALLDGESHDVDLQRVLSAPDQDHVRRTWVRYQAVSSVIRGEASHLDGKIDLSASIMAAIENEATPFSEEASPDTNEASPDTDKDSLGSGAHIESGESNVNTVVRHKRFMGLTGIWSGLGKTAIAASVTLVVIFGAQQFTSPGSQVETVATAPLPAGDPSGAVVPQGFELPPLSASTVSTNSFVDNKPILPRSSANDVRRGQSIRLTSDEFQDQINRLLFKHAEQVSSSGALGAMPYARVTDINPAAKRDADTSRQGQEASSANNDGQSSQAKENRVE